MRLVDLPSRRSLDSPPSSLDSPLGLWITKRSLDSSTGRIEMVNGGAWSASWGKLGRVAGVANPLTPLAPANRNAASRTIPPYRIIP
jgi:hypothetical protein